MRLAAERGTLAMRPLWFDDPGDEIAWTVDDELAVGPDHRRGADRGARRARSLRLSAATGELAARRHRRELRWR